MQPHSGQFQLGYLLAGYDQRLTAVESKIALWEGLAMSAGRRLAIIVGVVVTGMALQHLLPDSFIAQSVGSFREALMQL
jgi:hypothetical protein